MGRRKEEENEQSTGGGQKQSANPAEASDDDTESMMITTHAFSTVSNGKWIVDSGATSHMCNDREQFVNFKELSNKQAVTLGDGHTLDGTGIGTVKIETLLPDRNSRKCRLEKVLYVPKLSYNLLSVSKAAETGHTTTFSRLRYKQTSRFL